MGLSNMRTNQAQSRQVNPPIDVSKVKWDDEPIDVSKVKWDDEPIDVSRVKWDDEPGTGGEISNAISTALGGLADTGTGGSKVAGPTLTLGQFGSDEEIPSDTLQKGIEFPYRPLSWLKDKATEYLTSKGGIWAHDVAAGEIDAGPFATPEAGLPHAIPSLAKSLPAAAELALIEPYTRAALRGLGYAWRAGTELLGRGEKAAVSTTKMIVQTPDGQTTKTLRLPRSPEGSRAPLPAREATGEKIVRPWEPEIEGANLRQGTAHPGAQRVMPQPVEGTGTIVPEYRMAWQPAKPAPTVEPEPGVTGVGARHPGATTASGPSALVRSRSPEGMKAPKPEPLKTTVDTDAAGRQAFMTETAEQRVNAAIAEEGLEAGQGKLPADLEAKVRSQARDYGDEALGLTRQSAADIKSMSDQELEDAFVKMVQGGKDKSDVLYKTAHDELVERAIQRGLKEQEQAQLQLRPIRETIKDVNAALGQGGFAEFGDASRGLSQVQQAAAKRLKDDLAAWKKRAAITGTEIREFLLKFYDAAVVDSVLPQVEKAAAAADAMSESVSSLRTWASETIGGDAGTARQFGRGIKEQMNTPIVVVRKDPVAKRAIKYADYQDTKKSAFLMREGKEFEQFTKGITPEGSERIGKWLDNPDKVDDAVRTAHYNLSAEEERCARWMKDKYEWMIRHWGENRIKDTGGTAADFDKVLRLANKKNVKIDEVANLNGIEQEVYSMLQRRIKDYLPHIFEPEALLRDIEIEINDIVGKLTTVTDHAAQTRLSSRLRQLEQARIDLKGGKLVTYEALPENVRMRYFEPRTGKTGYSFDAIQAYHSYLTGMARKVYDEPFLRYLKQVFPDIAAENKDYMKWFARDYMGWNNEKLDPLWGAIRSFEWTRTLGLNPRSAIVNLTQQLNTVVEAGATASAKAWKKMFTPEGQRLWEESGLAGEVSEVLMAPQGHGKVLDALEKIRRISGFFFTKAETLNRKHAYLAGLEKYAQLPEAERKLKAIDVLHKTQFRYGRVGTPQAMRHGAASVALQFSSYPVKQFELLWHWARTDPKKAIAFLAAAEGGRLGLQEFLNTDLSNQLGFGIDYGEAIKAFASMTRGEMRTMKRHLELAAKQTGILPQGPGPAVQAVADLPNAFDDPGRYARKHLAPTMGVRMEQAYESITNKDLAPKGQYPIFSPEGEQKYTLSGKELLQRTVGPKPARETAIQREHEGKGKAKFEMIELSHDIANLIVMGEMDKAISLMQKYPLAVPSRETILEALKRRHIPESTRDKMETGKSRVYYEVTK